MTDSNMNVKIIKVENKLRKKVGFGSISETAISRSDSIIHNNSFDFKEIALPVLSKLRDTIVLAKENPAQIGIIRQELIKPIMELKANGAMFKYDLVGTLASIMLSFLEHINQLSKDAIEIIEAHEKTLSLIIIKGIKGDGGTLGTQLVNELEGACGRYYRKNPDKFN